MNNFKNSVVYQIYTKSFKDSNGDGIGDIRGVIEKLDYIKSLGVDYIWLTPFFQSPLKDNGYDVADYLAIDPLFGTMEDVEELISEADKRGIGLMFDMVFNHTSTEHEWFQKALTGDKKYMDYYIFKDGDKEVPPTNWKSKFGGSAWEYVPHLKKWYLHLFDKTQADLNWDNKEVREELKKVIRFWKNKGIKGFRFDVVNLISKPANFQNDETGDGRRFYTDGPHVHEYLKELVADTGMEDMITVGEMSSTSLDNCILYSNPSEKELSMTFHFHHLKVDYKDENKWEIQETDYRKLKKIFKSWQEGMQEGNGWNALFWCNHDQPRSVSRFGNDKLYWKESAKMLATCIHCMRGTPYIYQGEEIGITSGHFTDIHQYKDVESKNYYDIMRKAGKSHEEAIKILQARSRDNGRTPMQWSNEPYAGFSTAKPWIDVPKNYEYINVKIEESDQDSILQYYKELIKLRKNETLIADGEIKFILDDCEDVLAYKRFSNEEEILVLNNLKEKEVVLDLSKDLSKYKKLLGNYDGIILENTKIKLRPYESIVAKLSATI
ncbi:MAG: Trehalose-6-phosphate hydrolase [Lachnoclostridium sp.]